METIVTEASIANFMQRGLYYLLLALLIVNLLQRKHIKTGPRKRLATLYLAIVVLVLMTAAFMVKQFNISESLLLPVSLAAILLVLSKRSRFIPFQIQCLKCRQMLGWQRILYHDSNLCEPCEQSEQSEQSESSEPNDDKIAGSNDKEDQS